MITAILWPSKCPGIRTPCSCCCHCLTHCSYGAFWYSWIWKAGVLSAACHPGFKFCSCPFSHQVLPDVHWAWQLCLKKCFWGNKVAVDRALDSGPQSPWLSGGMPIKRRLTSSTWWLQGKGKVWYIEVSLASPFLTDLILQHLSHTDCIAYLCLPAKPWPEFHFGFYGLPLVRFCLHKSGSPPFIIHCVMDASQNLRDSLQENCIRLTLWEFKAFQEF